MVSWPMLTPAHAVEYVITWNSAPWGNLTFSPPESLFHIHLIFILIKTSGVQTPPSSPKFNRPLLASHFSHPKATVSVCFALSPSLYFPCDPPLHSLMRTSPSSADGHHQRGHVTCCTWVPCTAGLLSCLSLLGPLGHPLSRLQNHSPSAPGRCFPAFLTGEIGATG